MLTSTLLSAWLLLQPAVPLPTNGTVERIVDGDTLVWRASARIRLIGGDTRLTQVHRKQADADIHATALEDQFIEKGWS